MLYEGGASCGTDEGGSGDYGGTKGRQSDEMGGVMNNVRITREETVQRKIIYV